VLVEIGRLFDTALQLQAAAGDEFLNVVNAQFGVKILNLERFHVYLLFAVFVLLVYLLRSCAFGNVSESRPLTIIPGKPQRHV
jgi:hypothetical protein